MGACILTIVQVILYTTSIRKEVIKLGTLNAKPFSHDGKATNYESLFTNLNFHSNSVSTRTSTLEHQLGSTVSISHFSIYPKPCSSNASITSGSRNIPTCRSTSNLLTDSPKEIEISIYCSSQNGLSPQNNEIACPNSGTHPCTLTNTATPNTNIIYSCLCTI